MGSAAQAIPGSGGWQHGNRPLGDDPNSGASLVKLVRTEYLEMPGLSLDAGQAARLWNLSVSTSKDVLDQLKTDGFLVVTSRGQYIRA